MLAFACTFCKDIMGTGSVCLISVMCFSALLTTGANVNRATANNDHTVVSLACAGGHLAVVELLLAHGADPTHRLKVNLFVFF